MAEHLGKGTRVSWAWGAHRARGEVAQIFTSVVTRTIAGTEVTRKATADEPAYLVVQEDGGKALKSRSELRRLPAAKRRAS